MTPTTLDRHRSTPPVTVIMTVKNDPVGSKTTIASLLSQSRQPDEIVIVDGGSTDETWNTLQRLAKQHSIIRIIQAPGANIAHGRNLATSTATSPVIASIDSGCRAHSDWLAKLTMPFEEKPTADFVAGMYQIDAHTLLEGVVGLATMRGQLEEISPATFNPSGRSLAYTKELWKSAGGWPEWLAFSEDTLFAHTARNVSKRWHVAHDAVVDWRPRTSLRSIARQFYNYGTGRGHTQIDAPSFHYNLRNLAIVGLAGSLCLFTKLALIPLFLLLTYFYGVTFHGKAVRIANRTRRWTAYPLTFIVMWVVLFSNLAGYLVGSWQRLRDPQRYRRPMDRFLQTPQPHAA